MAKSTCRRLWFCVALLALFAATALVDGQPPAPDAKATLQRIGASRGICVVLGDPQGTLAVELAKASELLVYVQSATAEEVEAARRRADAAGFLGTRVYVEKGTLARIHLADNLADAVVVGESAQGANGVAQGELLRVLRPEGKALLGKTDLVKPVPRGIDDWTHPYHRSDNNPQSQDQLARGPLLTHFLAEPYYCPMPQVSVTAGGRVFKAFGNRSFVQPQWPWLNTLIAMNAYNGTILWKRELTPGFMIHRNTIIATPETLYLADDTSCKLIDAATGKVASEITVPGDLADGPVWKWMALEGGVLYALVGDKEPAEATQKIGGFRGAGWPWWKIENYPYGFGRTILAIDPASKKILWHHREKDPLDTRAMCMTGGRLYFYSNQKFLACLDAKSGKVIWKNSDADVLKAIGEHKPAQNAGEGFASTAYVKCSAKALYFAGPTRTTLAAVSTADGKLLWQHPDGNFQLVIRDDAVYAMGRGKSLKIEPLTGKILSQVQGRVACTRATASADAIFTRGGKGGSTWVYDLTSEQPKQQIISPMRPACQDGVLPVNGHFYWGPWMCRCDITQVGVMCLEPAGGFNFEGKASDKERLELLSAALTKPPQFPAGADDWPTYRKDNARSTRSGVAVPGQVRQVWEFKPASPSVATSPIVAADTAFVAGADGLVRSVDAASGKLRWTAYTGGPVKYSPSLYSGRLYVGSADGWLYCFEATTGTTLWRFRAAPQERKVPVFGKLSSTWPVASGVLVEDGVAYAAAGMFNYDGTHVYALDALTGKLRWQNNSSGNPSPETGPRGAGVQGHLLLNKNSLCLAGGNTSAVSVYDIADGKFTAGGGGGGKDLYLIDGQVRASGFPLYWRQEDSHFISLVEFPLAPGKLVVTTNQVALHDPKVDLKVDPKAKGIWTSQPFQENAAVALAKNAVIVAGVDRMAGKEEVQAGLCALNPTDGKLLWKQQLPAAPVSFGLAIDRTGKVLVSLQDGRVLCFGPEK